MHPLYKRQFSILKTLPLCKGIFGPNFSYGQSWAVKQHSNVQQRRDKSGATEWLTHRQFPYLFLSAVTRRQQHRAENILWKVKTIVHWPLAACLLTQTLAGFSVTVIRQYAPCLQTVQFYCLCVLEVNTVHLHSLWDLIYSNIFIKQSKEKVGPLSEKFCSFFPNWFNHLYFMIFQSMLAPI